MLGYTGCACVDFHRGNQLKCKIAKITACCFEHKLYVLTPLPPWSLVLFASGSISERPGCQPSSLWHLCFAWHVRCGRYLRCWHGTWCVWVFDTADVSPEAARGRVCWRWAIDWRRQDQGVIGSLVNFAPGFHTPVWSLVKPATWCRAAESLVADEHTTLFFWKRFLPRPCTTWLTPSWSCLFPHSD